MAIRESTGLRNARLAALFEGGFIGIYSGGQPASADHAETSSLLATISSASGTGGITFGTVGSGVLPKSAGVWSGLVGTAGICGWGRMYDINHTTGSNGTAVRMDFSIGVSGSDMVMSNTSLEVGATLTIDQAQFTEPAS